MFTLQVFSVAQSSIRVPGNITCSVHVNILSYYEIRWYLYRDCPVMTRWRDYRDFSGAAVL
jgi:hypothetical protein